MPVLFLIISLCATLHAHFPLHYHYDSYTTTIPTKPSRIVIAGGLWPLPSLLVMLEGNEQSIIYMPKASKAAIKHSFMSEVFPDIVEIQDGESENIEELLALKPDLFICSSTNLKLLSLMQKSTVPTISIQIAKYQYDSFETLKGWLEILAPILDQEQKARSLLTLIQSLQSQIESATQTLDHKPSALVIHYFENDTSISVGGIFANYLLEKTGAKNAITSKKVAKISLEELYTLNPDIIYINNFNTLLPQDLMANPLYQPLKAIQSKKVYKFPLGSYRPFAPSFDLPILLKWLYEHNHPDLADNTLTAYTLNFYRIFGLKLSPKQLDAIFNPSREAGAIR